MSEFKIIIIVGKKRFLLLFAVNESYTYTIPFAILSSELIIMHNFFISQIEGYFSIFITLKFAAINIKMCAQWMSTLSADKVHNNLKKLFESAFGW